MKKQSEAEWLDNIVGAAICDILADRHLGRIETIEPHKYISRSVLAALNRRGWKAPKPKKKGRGK